MIFLDFKEPTDKEWIGWRTKCKNATEELLRKAKSGDEIVFTALYKEKKDVFFRHDKYFYGKCAYCESLITSTHPGDVEHFRPKGKVTDLNNQTIKKIKNGVEIIHPGYYWLAYELSNLLPACEDCNRTSSGNSEGQKIGKWMKFPVKGMRAWVPGEEKKEKPLLINPVIEDPGEHLEIDNLGILHPKNNGERGETCIQIFGLNDRPSLVEERKLMYKQVKNDFKLALLSLLFKSEEKQELLDKINAYKMGQRPYSISARKAIEDGKIEYKNYVESI
ncbi:MAG: hypothetical protein O6940_01925 [Ignavibacteria bacterium]|nr:hypothetical protein [Ignavibacteria bacterium]